MHKRSKAFGRWLRQNAAPVIKAFLALVLLVILAFGAYLLLWQLPKHEAAQVDVLERRLEIENNIRATLAQIVLGLGIFVGLYLTYRRIKATERQAKAAENGQLTERFTRAIEQLGKQGDEHTAIRLGGIYALERIMRDSEQDAPTVQEVLAAFVRDESVSRWKRVATTSGPDDDSAPLKNDDSLKRAFQLKAHTDLQAALTVLARNPVNGERIDLSSAHLEGANLRGAHLQEAILEKAHLEGADLWGANLEGALLWASKMEGSILWSANLDRAVLTLANLEGAELSGARLEGAILERTNLQAADLRRADLRAANLTSASLHRAHLDGARFDGANLHGTILENDHDLQ